MFFVCEMQFLMKNLIFQLQSIQSTMNQFSPFVDVVVKNYSHEAVENLYEQLKEHPGAQGSQKFNCHVNEEYVIKRFINAALSREADIKFNAYFALSLLNKYIPALRTSINLLSLSTFILSQTNINKHCGGKPSEMQAYAVGKILIFKALQPMFVDNIVVITHLSELSVKYPDLQEQIIEVLGALVKGKKAQLAFSKLNPKTKAGFVLFTVLRCAYKGQQTQISINAIEDVINELVPLYPKRSICLTHLHSELKKNYEQTQQYLQQQLELSLNSETEEINFKRTFYLLQMLEVFLSKEEITGQNVWQYLNAELISYWLSQLKVQNKYIRNQALSIKVSFQQNPEMAFDILKELHQRKVNISNMNIKHPFFPLLEMVQSQAYLTYLINLCNKETSSVQTEQEHEVIHFNQLQVFVSVTHAQLKAESISKAVEVFVENYQNNKNDKTLQTLSRVFNSLLPESHKKKQQLQSRQSLVLLKLDLSRIELGQNQVQIKQAFKALRVLIKQAKDQQHPLTVAFLNFMVSVGYYFLIYPEEVELNTDLSMAFDDIKKNYLNSEEQLVPKKKRKLNEADEKNKAIHILVDIFISLLTKSPQFLRHSINSLFEHLIPFLDTQALSHLLQVIQRPDHDYLQEIQNE